MSASTPTEVEASLDCKLVLARSVLRLPAVIREEDGRARR
jgi:hypothetical protein